MKIERANSRISLIGISVMLLLCFGLAGSVWAASTVTMDTSEFPPLTMERGYCFFWEAEDTATVDKFDPAAAARCGLTTGWRNIKSDFSSEASIFCGSPDPEFYESGGSILSRQDSNWTSLREQANEHNLLIVQQICGTPYHDPGTPLWTLNTDYWNEGWEPYAKYAIPIENEFDDFGEVLADWMMDAELASDFPSIWLGSQEPDHTLGWIDGDQAEDEDKVTNIERYVRCWTPTARELKVLNRDVMVGGIQQNASAGGSGDTGDRYIYGNSYFLEYEESLGGTTPMDYMSIQNYKGENNDVIIHNAHYALTYAHGDYSVTNAEVTARYQKTPILINRYHHDKDVNPVENREESSGLCRLLTNELILIDSADIYGYALKREGIEDPNKMEHDVGTFLNKMPFERRPFSPDGDFEGFASGNDLGIYIVMWKTSKKSADVTIELDDLPSPGYGTDWMDYTLEVLKGSGSSFGSTSADLTHISGNDYEIDGFSLDQDDLALIRLDAGTTYEDDIDDNDLVQLKWTRMDKYCDRATADASPPSGSGHYDVRTAQLVVGADNSSAVGLAGVTFREVPTTRQVNLNFSLENLPAAGDESTILEVRVDYLNGDTTMKTLFITPDDYVHAGTTFWNNLDWRTIGTSSQSSQSIDPDMEINVNIGGNAPSGWSSVSDSDRGLMISLLLTNAPNTAMVKARLSDGVPGDTTPPAAPTGLAATGGTGQITLDWNNNTEGDLDGYNVYRSTTSGSGFSQINGSLVSASAYTDTTMTNGTTYYYVVTAVDTSSNESGYSNEDSAVSTGETTPPANPTGLAATGGYDEITLDWNDNTEGDLDGYNVYRSTTSGSGFSKINGSLVSASQYTDDTVSNDTTYYYVVTAVDTSSNESGYSNEDSAASSSGGSGTSYFSPSDDAYVEKANPSTNNGDSNQLRVRQVDANRQMDSYLKFTVSGISGSVSTALLQLYSDDVGMNVDAKAVADTSWSEGSIVWNNRPAMGSTLDTLSVGNGEWVEFDVTNHITGNGTFSLGLQGDSDDGLSNFWSKEIGAPYVPQLKVVY